MIGINNLPQIVTAFLRDFVPVAVHANCLNPVSRHSIAVSRLRDYYANSHLFQHPAQSLTGAIPVNWHISCARLQDSQQTDHHLQAPVSIQSHPRLWPNPQCLKISGKLVRSSVELFIGALTTFPLDGQGRWICLGMLRN